MLIVNLLAALAILSHETFVFFALPALVILSRPRGVRKFPRDLLFRSLALAPAVLVFLLAACYHGTPAIATAVHESWMPLWKTLAPDQAIIDPAASIAALGWSSQQGLYLSTYMLTSGLYQPLCWVTVFAISFLLIVLFTGRGENPSTRMETKARVTALLVAQFVFISPLFILGVDYGRWLFILGVDYGRWLFLWLASSLMLHICERRAPKWLEATIAQVFKRLKIPVVLGRVPAKDWYLLFFGVPVIWNIHNFMIASPVIRHLDLVRSWF